MPENENQSQVTEAPVEAPAEVAAEQSAAADRKPGRQKGRTKRVWTEAQRRAAAENLAKGREKARAAKGQAAPRVASGPTDAAIRDGISQLYGLVGMGVTMVDAEIGRAVVACTEPNPFGPGAPEAWVMLARQYPAVRAAIASLGGSAAIAAMFSAHLPLLMALQARMGQRALFGVGGPSDSTSSEPPAPPPSNGAMFTGAPVG